MNFIKRIIPDKFKSKLRKFISGKQPISNGLKAVALRKPFFIAVTTGNLHILKLCLKFVPKDQDVVVVLNGLEKWERQYAQRNLNVKGFIKFPFRSKYGRVINYLLDWMEQPFGILDVDCFVFCPEYFEEIKQLPDKSVISSFYGYRNEKTGLFFPETFFLFFDTPVLKQIIKKYRVDALEIPSWDQLPVTAQKKMMEIGISHDSLIEPYKPYFDTLRALSILCLAEGYQFYFLGGDPINYLKYQPECIFHVGANSGSPTRRVTVSKSKTRGLYFWHRALETITDRELKTRYQKKYGYLTAEEILKEIPNAREKLGIDFFATVDRVIGLN